MSEKYFFHSKSDEAPHLTDTCSTEQPV